MAEPTLQDTRYFKVDPRSKSALYHSVRFQMGELSRESKPVGEFLPLLDLCGPNSSEEARISKAQVSLIKAAGEAWKKDLEDLASDDGKIQTLNTALQQLAELFK